ncbi:MAG: hypothetical protein A3E78_10990 [Alphaproteobacteria bacterium RIFCSPHIGHO2_12_FULL_63_12]|nr:MAG: hypothetical protein A3E78_10990 [Alphaproteobacteria bacterium RIFCSPHIGHO2_12_FULL_63_12]
MPFAACCIPQSVYYRRAAFVAGLEKSGFRVTEKAKPDPRPGDVLVIWNRHRDIRAASAYEKAGAAIIVAENGYIGRDGEGRQFYALARSHHNGGGTWFVGEEDRWSRLGVPIKPWRESGDFILVLPQRGIGPPGVAMPRPWTGEVVRRLRHATQRPIRVRPHPGKEKSDPSPDFVDCWAAVTWGSGAGIKAIVAGIPVFHEFERWIGAPAARFGIGDLENPFLGDRMPMLQRLAYAQFTIDEISTGEPFRCLLQL